MQTWRWKATRLLGLACALAFLSGSPRALLDATASADPQPPRALAAPHHVDPGDDALVLAAVDWRGQAMGIGWLPALPPPSRPSPEEPRPPWELPPGHGHRLASLPLVASGPLSMPRSPAVPEPTPTWLLGVATLVGLAGTRRALRYPSRQARVGAAVPGRGARADGEGRGVPAG